jgi:plastocyanin
VKWVNGSGITHTVTRDEGEPLFDSGNLGRGGEFEFTFPEPSDDAGFFYYCRIHGQAMSGTVIVKPLVTTTEPTVVKMEGTRFEPPEVTTQVGGTVKWVNESNLTHTVTRDEREPLFDSGNLGRGGEFEFTFSEPSDDAGFFYYCRIHGESMSGIVIVKPAAENSPES